MFYLYLFQMADSPPPKNTLLVSDDSDDDTSDHNTSTSSMPSLETIDSNQWVNNPDDQESDMEVDNESKKRSYKWNPLDHIQENNRSKRRRVE